MALRGSVERIGAALGILADVRSGDEAFDDEFFVESPTPARTKALLQNEDYRTALRQMFETGVSEVRSLGDRVELKLNRAVSPEVPISAGLVEGFCSALAAIVTHRPLGPASEITWKRRPGLAASTGELVAFPAIIFAVGLLSFHASPRILNQGQWFKVTAYAFPAWVAFVGVSAGLLKLARTRRDHLRASPVYLLTAVLFGMLGMYAIDATWTRRAFVFEGMVTSKESHSKEEYLLLSPRDGTGGVRKLQVSRSEFLQATPDKTLVELHIRQGLLGLERVEARSMHDEPVVAD